MAIDFTALERPADKELATHLRTEAKEGLWGSLAQRDARRWGGGGYWRRLARLKAFADANGFVARPSDPGEDLSPDVFVMVVCAAWRVLGVLDGRRFQIGRLEKYDLPPTTFIEVLSPVALPTVRARVNRKGVVEMLSGTRAALGDLLTDELREVLAAARMDLRTTSSAVYAITDGREMDAVGEWRHYLRLVEAIGAALAARESSSS